jgi:hypothetical protein
MYTTYNNYNKQDVIQIQIKFAIRYNFQYHSNKIIKTETIT